MIKTKLNRISWFKHASKDSQPSRKVSFRYFIEGFGDFEFDTELPVDLSEEIDSYGQKKMWEKLDEIKKQNI